MQAQMMRRLVKWALALGLVVALGAVRSEAGIRVAEERVGTGGTRASDTRVEGKITAVNAQSANSGSVTIQTQSGKSVTVSVSAGTKLERNGARTTMFGIRVGDLGQARIDNASGLTTKLEAKGP